jgi:hypothetical protein
MQMLRIRGEQSTFAPLELWWTSFALSHELDWLAIRSSPKAREGWWTRFSPVGTH